MVVNKMNSYYFPYLNNNNFSSFKIELKRHNRIHIANACLSKNFGGLDNGRNVDARVTGKLHLVDPLASKMSQFF